MHTPSRDHTARCDVGCPLAGATAGIDRRTFLAQGALAAAYATAAATLAACGSGGVGDPTSPTAINGSLAVADYASVAGIGGVTTVTISGTPLAIVRTGASSFLALSRICPHAGATVDVVSSGFYCPRHGAQFDASGRWTGGQSTGNRNLTSYPTMYDATTGTLTIG